MHHILQKAASSVANKKNVSFPKFPGLMDSQTPKKMPLNGANLPDLGNAPNFTKLFFNFSLPEKNVSFPKFVWVRPT